MGDLLKPALGSGKASNFGSEFCDPLTQARQISIMRSNFTVVYGGDMLVQLLYMLFMLTLMGIGFTLMIVQPIPGALVIGALFIVTAFFVALKGRAYRKKYMEEQAEKYRQRHREYYEKMK